MRARPGSPKSELWVVEVAVELVRDEFGDALPDLTKYEEHAAETSEQALEIARRELPRDVYGSVRIMRKVATWVDFGDGSGDWDWNVASEESLESDGGIS